MTKLSVNLNKIALLRNSRNSGIPSVTEAAETCIAAGADGITVHPRPDARHIREMDVYSLAGMLTVEFNIEGNPFPDFMQLIRRIRPTQCTLVPDDPNQLTSNHGWDLAQDAERLKPIIKELKGLGVRVSLFMDPDSEHIETAKDLGADRIELYTESFAHAVEDGNTQAAVDLFSKAATTAQAVGLGVNGGHDLNLDNLSAFASIPNILEVSIGHALVADALYMGLEKTVRAYKTILLKAGGEK